MILITELQLVFNFRKLFLSISLPVSCRTRTPSEEMKAHNHARGCGAVMQEEGFASSEANQALSDWEAMRADGRVNMHEASAPIWSNTGKHRVNNARVCHVGACMCAHTWGSAGSHSKTDVEKHAEHTSAAKYVYPMCSGAC